ncbi:phosphoadenylyl-sulfate reductase [Kroppenstedtia eburnea]|uniref:phosphoadenylyl-sulfate reductase n=1 Tax=Kroppenstedtia eburnea TaxID=714067 RepID=UPI00362CF724
MNGSLTFDNWDPKQLPHFPIDDESNGAQEVIRWSFAHYGPDLVYACSFGAESMVLIDLLSQVSPKIRLVFLDTGLHFRETYETIDAVVRRYPKLHLERIRLVEQGVVHGERLWERNPDLCCHLRKILPLKQALSGAAAWISGLRREQSPIRQFTRFLNRDEKFGLIKICPLVHWTEAEVWEYIRVRDLPYNKLHIQGYPSIGCAPCTRPVAKGEDPRAGRWSGTGKTECGLHPSSWKG